MEREIKYQAFFDVEDKRRGMYDVRAIIFEKDDYTKSGYVQLDHSVNPADDGRVDRSLVKLREFTGLKDKNGVEIFEGDIVRWLNDFSEQEETRVIKWHEEYTYSGWNISRAYEHECEVIGNIYENPELIKGAKHE